MMDQTEKIEKLLVLIGPGPGKIMKSGIGPDEDGKIEIGGPWTAGVWQINGWVIKFLS